MFHRLKKIQIKQLRSMRRFLKFKNTNEAYYSKRVRTTINTVNVYTHGYRIYLQETKVI